MGCNGRWPVWLGTPGLAGSFEYQPHECIGLSKDLTPDLSNFLQTWTPAAGRSPSAGFPQVGQSSKFVQQPPVQIVGISPTYWTLGIMPTIGYARVSTKNQTLDQQLDALTAAGAQKVFTDVMSGTRDDRPGLAALLDYVRDGDVVVVVALDRLGRSLPGIIRTVQALTERSVLLRSLREGIDYSTVVGRMLAGIFGALAEYERSLIAERAEAAREAARVRGRQVGRPRAITAEQLRAARAMRAAGEPIPSICRSLGVKRATLYKALSEIQDPA